MFHKIIKPLLVLTLPLAAAACAQATVSAGELQQTLDAAVQQTVAAQAAIQLAAATPTPAPLQPAENIGSPAQAVCSEMMGYLTQSFALPVDVTAATFDNAAGGLTGEGCTVKISATDEQMNNWMEPSHKLDDLLKANGWQDDIMFSAAGPGSIMNTYRGDGMVCEKTESHVPVDENACAPDQPFTLCMDALQPDQKIYSITFNCSVDSAFVP